MAIQPPKCNCNSNHSVSHFSRSIINIYVLTSVQLVHHLWIWKERGGTEKGRRKLISRYYREENKRAAVTWILCDDAACEHRLLWIVVGQSRALVGSCDTDMAASRLAARRIRALWHSIQKASKYRRSRAAVRLSFWPPHTTASSDVVESHYLKQQWQHVAKERKKRNPH